jgi:hypothetical protein
MFNEYKADPQKIEPELNKFKTILERIGTVDSSQIGNPTIDWAPANKFVLDLCYRAISDLESLTSRHQLFPFPFH